MRQSYTTKHVNHARLWDLPGQSSARKKTCGHSFLVSCPVVKLPGEDARSPLECKTGSRPNATFVFSRAGGVDLTSICQAHRTKAADIRSEELIMQERSCGADRQMRPPSPPQHDEDVTQTLEFVDGVQQYIQPRPPHLRPV